LNVRTPPKRHQDQVYKRKAQFLAQAARVRGGKAKDWREAKGKAKVRFDNGEVKAGAEVHWVEAHGIGGFEIKVKKRSGQGGANPRG
jgi:hypothetical protein